MISIISIIITVMNMKHVASLWICSLVAIPFSRWQVQRCCSICYIKVSALSSVCEFDVWHCRSVAVEWNASAAFLYRNVGIETGLKNQPLRSPCCETKKKNKFYKKLDHVVTLVLSQKPSEIRNDNKKRERKESG